MEGIQPFYAAFLLPRLACGLNAEMRAAGPAQNLHDQNSILFSFKRQ
jgi:hypothetical protein